MPAVRENPREIAFKKLCAITESEKFKKLRLKIIEMSLNQRESLAAEKFFEFIEKNDIPFTHIREILSSIKRGLLKPCYRENNKRIELFNKSIVSSKRTLKKHFFHPYRILEAFNCGQISSSLQFALLSWWRSKRHKRRNLQHARKIDDTKFGSMDPNWVRSLVDLAIVLEPIYTRRISGSFHLHNYWTFRGLGLEGALKGFKTETNKIFKGVKALTDGLEKEDWVNIHDFACFISDRLYENKELKTLITLMKPNEIRDVNGKLGAAIIAREVAQCIRYLAQDKGVDLQEEIFREHGNFTDAYFTRFRGSRKILEGNRSAKLKFVRGFGLDFSLRARIYVEGETEFGCFTELLKKFEFVEIIDLKGAFAEKGGKGLAFRESLRNDRHSSLYSLIVLDGDVGDNVRIVRDAAKKTEFMGQYFIGDPDFELGNFSIDELCKIVSNNFKIRIDSSKFSGIKSGNDCFKKLHTVYPKTRTLKKGKDWGKMLAKYAYLNPKTKPLGLADDRPINQVIRFCLFSDGMYFSNDLNNKVINAKGLMVERVVK